MPELLGIASPSVKGLKWEHSTWQLSTLYSCVLGRVPKNLIYVLACHPPHDFPMQFSNKSKQAPLLHFSLSPVHIVSLGQRKQIYFFLLKRYSYQSSDSNNRIISGSYNTENAFQVMRIQHIEWSDLNHNLVIHLTFHIYWYPMTGQPLVIP